MGLTAHGRRHIGAAVDRLRLDTEIHADSRNAFGSRGEVRAKNSDKALAIAAYRQPLVLNPKKHQRGRAIESARGAALDALRGRFLEHELQCRRDLRGGYGA